MTHRSLLPWDWRELQERIAKEEDRDQLAALLWDVNRLLDLIEQRLSELDKSGN